MNTSTNDTSSKTVALIGAGGFIGSHLCDWIIKNTDWKVIALDLENRKIEAHLKSKQLEFIRGDYQSDNSLQYIVDKSDVVINLASLCNPSQYNVIPLDVMESNYNAPLRLVNACAAKGVWLIHFSTSEVYGRTIGAHMQAIGESTQNRMATLLTEDSPMIMGKVQNQRWCYAAAKQMLERWIFAHNQSGTLPFTIIRPFNFVGPRMDYMPGVDGEGVPRVIACFMDALLHNKELQLVDGGHNQRCFTWIGDVVEAIIAIINNPKESQNQIFNIGNPNNELSIAQLAYKMAFHYGQLTNKESSWAPRYKEVSSQLFYGKGYEDSDRRLPDIRKAKLLLKWNPNVSIDEALHHTVKWFIEEYAEKKVNA